VPPPAFTGPFVRLPLALLSVRAGLPNQQRMHRAWLITLFGVASGVVVGPVLAAVGIGGAADVPRFVLGWLGLIAFTVTLCGAAYTAISQDASRSALRGWFAAFAAAAVLSVPTVGPLGTADWQTWAFLSSSVIGAAALLPVRTAIAVGVLTVGVSALVALWVGASVLDYVQITLALGMAVAAWNGLHRWFWMFLVQSQTGQDALTRLAATEERLRFARDVHDLLGHNLSVIALKAELTSRLAQVDPERASREADEVRRIAAAAIVEMREVVHGYRRVDLREATNAVAEVLRSSGVRCTVTQPDEDLPPDLATPLGPVLREASTNVMRHSRAKWCTIDLTFDGSQARLRISNDGAEDSAGPDRYSSGLHGLADRLGAVGGTLRTEAGDGLFTLEATVGAPR